MSAEGRHTALNRVSTKRSHPRARLLRPRASLLSSQLHLAGVGATTSRLFRPREPDLRNRWRLFFCPGDLRGQPGFHDMPPTVPTNSRNQCAPVFWEAVKLTLPAGCAMVNLRALSVFSLSCSCSPLQGEGVEQEHEQEEEIQRRNFAMLATRPASD